MSLPALTGRESEAFCSEEMEKSLKKIEDWGSFYEDKTHPGWLIFVAAERGGGGFIGGLRRDGA